jgi:hypothetical protein
MKRHNPWKWMIVFAVFLAATPLANAQPTTQPAAAPADAAAAANLPSVDEIMNKYIEATGGRAAYEKVTSRVTKGKISIPAANVAGTLESYQVNGKVYITFDIAGIGKTERGYDGTTAWETSAAQGPRIIDGAEKDDMVREAKFDVETNWKKYFTASVTGTDTVNGDACYKVVFTKPDKTTETRYFSKDSGLEVKTEGTQKTQQGQIDTVETDSDYKDFGALKIATKVEQNAGGVTAVITTDSVEDNVPVADDKFVLPDDIKQLVSKKPG